MTRALPLVGEEQPSTNEFASLLRFRAAIISAFGKLSFCHSSPSKMGEDHIWFWDTFRAQIAGLCIDLDHFQESK
jgi:hypothetical protein